MKSSRLRLSVQRKKKNQAGDAHQSVPGTNMSSHKAYTVYHQAIITYVSVKPKIVPTMLIIFIFLYTFVKKKLRKVKVYLLQLENRTTKGEISKIELKLMITRRIKKKTPVEKLVI